MKNINYDKSKWRESKMKKRLFMLLFSLIVIGTAGELNSVKSYALIQEEIIAQILERNPDLRGKQTADPAPGHEYGGSFDDLVQSVKDHNDRLVRERAAERGLTIRQYLEQTGQTCPATSSNRKILDKKPEQLTGEGTIKETTGGQTVVPAEPQPPEHSHSYREKVTKEATCREEGKKTFTCDCGEAYKEVIKKKDHDYMETLVSDPTCREKGEKAFVCKVCGDNYVEELPKTDHMPGASQTTKEPSCTESGRKEVFCKYCGTALKRQPVEALGHEKGEEKVEEAGWFKDGKAVTHCIRCGEELESRIIPAEKEKGYAVVGSVLGVVLVIIIVVVLKKKKGK